MNTDVILLLALDLFLKCTFVVVFALLVFRLWKHASAAQRCCIWSVAFAVIIALPATRLIAPHWALSLHESTKVEASHDNQAPMEIAPNSSDNSTRALPVIRKWPTLNGTTTLAGVWIIGAILLLGYRLIGIFLLYRCHGASSPLQDGDDKTLADSITTDYGISRRVEFRLSQDCPVPVTWGTWRPVVVLPGEALGWPRKWLESALRHEMGHVKNFDHLKRWIAFLACSFYWPNPLVWVAAKKLHVAQEEASDNLVLEVNATPQDYATQLIEVIRATAGPARFPWPAMAMARRSTLESRLLAILDETCNRGHSGRRLVVLAVGLAVILGAALGAAQLRADDTPSPYSFLPNTTDADQALFKQSLNTLILPSIELHQVTVLEALEAVRVASKKTNPPGLGMRSMVEPQAAAGQLKEKIDLRLENGTLKDAITLIAREANLQYKITPSYAYYMNDSDDVIHPHITKVLCNLWPAHSPESMWGRVVIISDGGMRVLHLQPTPSGDVRESLEKWGIQFPLGTFAICNPEKTRPGQNELTIRNAGDEVAQVLNLVMAASSEEWHPAPASPK